MGRVLRFFIAVFLVPVVILQTAAPIEQRVRAAIEEFNRAIGTDTLVADGPKSGLHIYSHYVEGGRCHGSHLLLGYVLLPLSWPCWDVRIPPRNWIPMPRMW